MYPKTFIDTGELYGNQKMSLQQFVKGSGNDHDPPFNSYSEKTNLTIAPNMRGIVSS